MAEVQTIGQNVKATIDDEKGTLVLVVDLKAKGQESASGKSVVVASTRGNKAISACGKVLNLGVNLYAKK